MTIIHVFSAQPWVARLGWTLLHFLWQGLIAGSLYAAARARLKESSPQVRYVLACAAMLMLLLAPVVTYGFLGSTEGGAAMPTRPDGVPAAARNSDSGTTFPVTGGEAAVLQRSAVRPAWAVFGPERVLPVVVMLWLAGALVFFVRLSGGWIAGARLQAQCACRVPAEWEQSLDRMRTQLRVGQRVRILVSGLVEMPTVIGWLRPVVLVPIEAVAGMPPKHLEALLLHELAHIRRHDNLINLLQSTAEALLFYHPAVWWLSGHIRADRELCCDDVAAGVVGDVLLYATALAELEACRPAHSVSVLAANGGRLADRIARLLGQTRAETQTVSARGATSAILLALMACVVLGQPAERPKFEVASVKSTPEDARSYSGIRPIVGGRLLAQNCSVRQLLMNAYRLRDFQVIEGAAWLRDQGFDVEAKGDSTATQERVMLMLQSLLEERFQLRYHRETRELPVLALIVGKNGSKLTVPKEGGCVKPDPTVSLPASGCGVISVGMSAGRLNARGGDVPMAVLIRQLSSLLGRPVLDKTGITTNFDVRLEFAADDSLEGMMKQWGTVEGHRESMMASAAAAEKDPRGSPNIFLAVQEQLGLKLEATKGPVEVMVIDHVERPGAN